MESFCPKGTLPPENPRVANTRKEDSVPIGIKGPFKKKKRDYTQRQSQHPSCRVDACHKLVKVNKLVRVHLSEAFWSGPGSRETSLGTLFHLCILISCVRERLLGPM